MGLKKQFLKMEKSLIAHWAEYVKLNDELNLFRGKQITDENTNDINRLVRQIQESFIEMYPIFIFINERHTFCNKALHQYNQFIDDIKKAGATEYDQNNEAKS